jgi:hypothetical protein
MCSCLANEISDFTGEYELYEALSYNGDLVSDHVLQIVCCENGRAGIALRGNGSSGITSWTDANSAEEALRRYLDGDMND